jgi:hypothetical protein
MRSVIRRTIVALCAVTLLLGASGCSWVLWDAPKLWQTEHLAGIQNRGQDVNYMRGTSSQASLGGW